MAQRASRLHQQAIAKVRTHSMSGSGTSVPGSGWRNRFLALDRDGIANGDAARLHCRAIDTEVGLSLLCDRAKNRRVTVRRERVDVHHYASLVPFVDAHRHSSHAHDAAYPLVFAEGDRTESFDHDVRAKAQDIQLESDNRAELSHCLRGYQ